MIPSKTGNDLSKGGLIDKIIRVGELRDDSPINKFVRLLSIWKNLN